MADAPPPDPRSDEVPSRLFAGELPPRPRLAIVGSRAASRPLRRRVPALVAACRDAGWSVVSGGARGIDGDAHRAALAQGVPQLVILPLGPDRPYPPEHAGLFARIGRAPRSGIACAQPEGTLPSRGMFASRNRLVVAAADAVLVVEAQMRSGTLQTGRIALHRGVPLAVWPGTPGCAELAGRGAVRLDPLAGPDGGLARFLAGRAVEAEDRWPAHLGALREALYAAPRGGLSAFDLPGGPISLCQLAEAEALGLVVETAPGRYRMA